MRAILTYHSIDNSGSPVSVTPAAFRQHVEWLASGSTRVLSLGDIVHGSQSGNAVALTFDDGFENFSTEAWPLLRAHRFPATLFVVTGQVGRTNAWQGREEPGIPTLPLLGWAALERLAGDALEIGGHTRTHQSLSNLDVSEATDEVEGCRHDLRTRLGVPCDSFAYPYGDAPPNARRRVREAFASGCTTTHRALAATDAPEALPRLDMYYFQGNGALDNWGGWSFRARVAGRRALRGVRSVLRGAGGRP